MDSAKILQWIVGLFVAALIGYLGWLGASINSISTRLTAIETTITEGRAERIAQINDLRERMTRVEQAVFQTAREGR